MKTITRRSLRPVQIIVTLVLVVLLLRSLNWEVLPVVWQELNLPNLVFSAVLSTISIICGALGLLILLDRGKPWRWWSRFTLDYFYVQAICQLTPAQTGEAVLPFVASRKRFGPGAIAASLVVQRMTSLAVLVVALLAGAHRWAPTSLLLGVSAIILVICATLAILINMTGIRTWFSEIMSRKFGSALAGFYDSWVSIFRDHRPGILLHVSIMIIRFVVSVAATSAALTAFDITLPFWELASLSALAAVASLVPISINGWGVTEGIFVLALSDYGFAAERVLVACVVMRALAAVTVLPWVVAYVAVGLREKKLLV